MEQISWSAVVLHRCLPFPPRRGYQTLQGDRVQCQRRSVAECSGQSQGANIRRLRGHLVHALSARLPVPWSTVIISAAILDKSLSREWTVRADYAGTNDSILVRYTDSYESSRPICSPISAISALRRHLAGRPGAYVGRNVGAHLQPNSAQRIAFFCAAD